jgi:HlyD family secretion protein
MQAERKKSRWSGRLPMAAGILSVIVLVAVLGIWGTQAKLSGAIIAPGIIEVESNRQVVQHEEGGVVAEIFARDGDQVAAGDVVIRLDGTFLKSELSVIEGQYFEVLARRARLEADQADAARLVRPAFPVSTTLSSQRIDAIFDGQVNLFEARLESLALAQEQLQEQVTQLENQITGVESELGALSTQRGLVAQDMAETGSLVAQGLSETRPLRQLQREEADIGGRIGRLNALIAEHRGQIADVRLQISGLQTQRREDAITELDDLNYRSGELAERRLTLLERLSRLDVRAPMSGRVFGSTIAALQSIVQGASPMLYIVPDNSPLVVRARIQTVDIDKISAGQAAALRFSALDMRHTPEIPGTVQSVAADATEDPATGMTYYETSIIPDEAGMALLNGQELVVGMPTEVLIRTTDRTPLNYLIKPLTDYFFSAMREE